MVEVPHQQEKLVFRRLNKSPRPPFRSPPAPIMDFINYFFVVESGQEDCLWFWFVARHSMDTQLLTVKDVASKLSLSPKTVYRLITSGKLRAYKLGGAVRVAEADLEAWVSGNAFGVPCDTPKQPPVNNKFLKLKYLT